MLNRIKENTENIFNKIVEIRRDFHKYAESGWLEIRTASIIAEKLENLGYEVKSGKEVVDEKSRMGVPEKEILDKNYERAISQGAVIKYAEKLRDGFTGVAGILKNGEGPVVALRFDIDALDIDESEAAGHFPFDNGFSSVNKYFMHACGHDTHASVGLGMAEVLMNMKDFFKGTIKLIFQPAEEGVRGAKSIVESGILDDVDYIFGHHIMSGYKKGQIMAGMGGYLATNKFDVFIKGNPAHAGGSPEGGNNAMLAASNIVLNLYAIPRHSDGITRINVGKLTAGTGRNVVCDNAHLVIETRGGNNKLSQFMYEKAKKVIHSSCEMYGCEVIIKDMGTALSGFSSKELTSFVETNIKEKFPELEVISSDRSMGSEDFTYMMDRVQKNGGQAVNIGVGAEVEGKELHAHTKEYDIDETSMRNTIELLTYLTLNIK